MSLLEARELCVSIEERPILQQVSMSLERGELVGLIGPNGAGKSTLLNQLACLDKQTTGDVLYNGQSVRQLSIAELSKTVGYLAQGAPAHWPLRVDKVVELGRLPHLSWWQRLRGDDERIIDWAMQMAEVAHLRERIVTTLSGGERMRVFLARVLAAEPTLILADEPVAALDPYHQLHVMEILQQHAHRGGGVVAVLHDLNLAARFCDRLVLIHEGRIVCSGGVREVLDNRYLKPVYGIEASIRESESGLTVIPEARMENAHHA